MTRESRPEGRPESQRGGCQQISPPAPGARPGELIAIGPNHRYLAYQIDGEIVAACYLEGALLRRDLAGWWVASFMGERRAVDDRTVAPLVGSVPDGWPVLACQTPLLGQALLNNEEMAA